MHRSLLASGLFCALPFMGMGQAPAAFDFHHIPKAEEDHTYQPGLFSRFKVLTEKEIVSADREIGGKKLVVNFYRYDRVTGALLGTSKAEVEGESPRFERMLRLNGHIYMLFTTREEKTHYKVYARVYDEAIGTVGQERHFLGELNILNRMFDTPFADLELKLRFQVSEDEHRVFMFNDELRTPDQDERRVLSLWVFDDLLAPVWKATETTPAKYNLEHFSDLAVTNEGVTYALDLTEAPGQPAKPEGIITGKYSVHRWSNGEHIAWPVDLPRPLDPITAHLSLDGAGVLVTGFHANDGPASDWATVGAFAARSTNGFGAGEPHIHPLDVPYAHPIHYAQQVLRPDGGFYILGLERTTGAGAANTDTGIRVFALAPNGEQEWVRTIPRAQRSPSQAIFWAGGGQGFHARWWEDRLLVAFYDTEDNLSRYQSDQQPTMTEDRIRTTMAAVLGAQGGTQYLRLTPKDHCAFAGPLTNEPNASVLLLQSSRANEDGRSYGVGFGVLSLIH